MFDKLVVSEPDKADFKGRGNYFVVSSLVVGILFVTAVVVSIFASDFGLGNGNFELTEMLAPVEMAATMPETPRPQPATPSRSTDSVPSRQVNMLDINETPKVPDSISTTANTQKSRPIDRFFTVGRSDTDPVNPGGNSRAFGTTTDGPSGLAQDRPVNDTPTETAPPPTKPKTTVSKGVINGSATSLPKPEYSAMARAAGAQGRVDVQVTIDENGNVISARAMNGHPLLRGSAENAARKAKFSKTYLSEVPVKVTGLIVYNFVK